MTARSFDINATERKAPSTTLSADARRKGLGTRSTAIALGAAVAVLLVFAAVLASAAAPPHAWLGFRGGIPDSPDLWKLAAVQLLAAALCGYLAGQPLSRATQPTEKRLRREQRDGALSWLLASSGIALLTALWMSGPAPVSVVQSHDVLMTHVNGLFEGAEGRDAVERGAQEQLATQRSANELADIFVNTIPMGVLPLFDQRYAGQILVQRTGLTQREAERRVGEVYVKAKEDLHQLDLEAQARDAIKHQEILVGSLWWCGSLLIGAWVASKAALRGRRASKPARLAH